ncbi:WxcM domain protein domain protein [Hymenobacter roseosalivarius DSM 11622]|uniref:WxcM domain protein domain protein n=1 Tax=Hymenobacter roseosalivarius DSM 11622 TaxID=645990 RepID=A0A1W1V8P3_9BACT|nr:FdtA/QdtA family cupin domain-containing protein [Hymenobacter roseosalivarius]SMB89401.1 WxcM domain protein domain protein [Hymenobacter roseosalivarius DSM 11622]
MTQPYLIEFPKLGDSTIGFISVTEELRSIPFEVKRTFWTYYTPESIVRGRHAHHLTEQVLVAAAGRIIVTTEMPDGTVNVHRLEDPHVGLYVPPCTWHTMQYSHSAVQLVFASHPYDEQDYIRRYDQFREVWKA